VIWPHLVVVVVVGVEPEYERNVPRARDQAQVTGTRFEEAGGLQSHFDPEPDEVEARSLLF
jgi:hypothetical protein